MLRVFYVSLQDGPQGGNYLSLILTQLIYDSVSIEYGQSETVDQSDNFNHIQNLIDDPCQLNIRSFYCENYRSRLTLSLLVVKDCRYIVSHFYFNNIIVYNSSL